MVSLLSHNTTQYRLQLYLIHFSSTKLQKHVELQHVMHITKQSTDQANDVNCITSCQLNLSLLSLIQHLYYHHTEATESRCGIRY